MRRKGKRRRRFADVSDWIVRRMGRSQRRAAPDQRAIGARACAPTVSIEQHRVAYRYRAAVLAVVTGGQGDWLVVEVGVGFIG